jgi:hypothetical protein
MTKLPTPPPLAQKTLQADPTTRFEASIHMGKNGSPYSTLLRSSLKNHAWLASKPVYIYANAFQALFKNLRLFLADFDPGNVTPPEWCTIKDLGPWISSATPGNWFFHGMLQTGNHPAILGITQRFPKNREISPRTLYVKYPEIGALLDFLNELQGELAKHAPAPTRKNKPRPFFAPPAANAPVPEPEGSSVLRETPAAYSVEMSERDRSVDADSDDEDELSVVEEEDFESVDDCERITDFPHLEWIELIQEKRHLLSIVKGFYRFGSSRNDLDIDDYHSAQERLEILQELINEFREMHT